MHTFLNRWARIFLVLVVVILSTAACVSHWNRRVRASRAGLTEIARRYPIGSRERSTAVRAEMMRRLHPHWRDLTVSEMAAKLAFFAGRLVHSHDLPGTSDTPPVAPFLGNFTTISSTYPQEFVLTREADCSLTYNSGTFNFSLANPGYSITNKVAHYDQTLHSEAALKTAGGTFPAGCAVISGSSTRAIMLGKTSQGLYVIAIAGYDRTTGNNALYYGAIDSNYNYHSLAVDDSNPNITRVTGGDLNHDGNGDIIEVGFGASISVLLGNADGSFQSPVTYAIAGTGATAAVVDDFDGDGKLDVAVVSRDRHVSILYGRGDGTLMPAQSFAITNPADYSTLGSSLVGNIITADTRGIGRRDIITSDGVVLLSNGDGTFTTAPKSAFPQFSGTSDFGPNLVAADLNKDNKVDVVFSDGASINIYLGNGDGTFTPGQGYGTIDNVGYLTVADLDGDGNLDIYSGTTGGPIFGGDQFETALSYALLGNGDGTFVGASVSKQEYAVTNLGDVNGDGHQDLVGFTAVNNSTGGTNNNFTTYLGQKDGSFAPTGSTLSVSSVTVGTNTYPFSGINTFAVADVNGDGKADLVFIPTALTTFNERDILVVALGKADGSFGTPMAVELPSLLTNPAMLPTGPDFDFDLVAGSLQIADVNGDGKMDIFYSYQDSDYGTSALTSGFVFQPGNGDGTFGAPKTLQTYSGSTVSYMLPQFVLFADVNGDGKPDLVSIQQTGSASTGFRTQVLLNLNKGDGSFGASSTLQLGDPVGLPILGPSIVAADINHDGHMDLISLGTDANQDGSIAISLGRGDGTFAAAIKTPVQDGDVIGTDGLAVADFNGDGKLDVAITSFIPGSSGIYFGNGDGTLAPFKDSSDVGHPSETIQLSTFGAAIAYDFDGDGKMDLLAGNLLLRSVVAPSAIPPTTSTIGLSASATSILTGAQITFTATVTGPSGNSAVPSGTVTFLDGATSIGTGTLDSSGKATLAISSLAAGVHSITASYSGDATFAVSVSSTVSITVAAPAMDFSIASGASSGTVTSTAPATAMLTITSINSFASPVNFGCSGLPSGVACAFNPASVTPAAGATATTTVTFSKSAIAGLLVPRSGIPLGAFGTGLLGLTLARRRRFAKCRRFALCAFLAGFLIPFSGCSGGSGNGGNSPTTANITITASSGSLSHSAPYTLTVK